MLSYMRRYGALLAVVMLVVTGLVACSNDDDNGDTALPPTTDSSGQNGSDDTTDTTSEPEVVPTLDDASDWGEAATEICRSYDEERERFTTDVLALPDDEVLAALMADWDMWYSYFESQLEEIRAIEAPDEGEAAAVIEQLQIELDVLAEMGAVAEADDEESFGRAIYAWSVREMLELNDVTAAAGVAACGHPELEQ